MTDDQRSAGAVVYQFCSEAMAFVVRIRTSLHLKAGERRGEPGRFDAPGSSPLASSEIRHSDDLILGAIAQLAASTITEYAAVARRYKFRPWGPMLSRVDVKGNLVGKGLGEELDHCLPYRVLVASVVHAPHAVLAGDQSGGREVF